MPILALGLVLVAALLHALWNIVAKHAGGNRHFALVCGLMLAALWLPVALWAGIGAVVAWGWKAWAFVVASAVTHLGYFLSLLRGYRESDLTVVYPVARGTGPLLSSLGAMLLLAEQPTVFTLLGLAGITLGIVMIAGGPALWRRAHRPGERSRVHAGLRWGAATGALIAGYTVLDGYSVKVLAISPILIDYFGNLCRIPFMLAMSAGDRAGLAQTFRTMWRHALLVAAVSPLGYILVLYAVRMAPLSHVAPAREISMLFAALIGGRLLGEDDRGWRMLGAACMAVGVAALAWG